MKAQTALTTTVIQESTATTAINFRKSRGEGASAQERPGAKLRLTIERDGSLIELLLTAASFF